MLANENLHLASHHKIIDLIPLSLRNLIFRLAIRLRLLRTYGHAVITVYDKEGRIKSKGEGYNLVVDVGKGELGDLMIGAVTNSINNINVGTSSQTPAASDTDLISAATPVKRQAIAAGGRFRTNLLLTFSVLIPSTDYTRPVTIREIGLFFDPNATGKLFARAVITDVTLNSGDSARADYEIQL